MILYVRVYSEIRPLRNDNIPGRVHAKKFYFDYEIDVGRHYEISIGDIVRPISKRLSEDITKGFVNADMSRYSLCSNEVSIKSFGEILYCGSNILIENNSITEFTISKPNEFILHVLLATKPFEMDTLLKEQDATPIHKTLSAHDYQENFRRAIYTDDTDLMDRLGYRQSLYHLDNYYLSTASPRFFDHLYSKTRIPEHVMLDVALQSAKYNYKLLYHLLNHYRIKIDPSKIIKALQYQIQILEPPPLSMIVKISELIEFPIRPNYIIRFYQIDRESQEYLEYLSWAIEVWGPMSQQEQQQEQEQQQQQQQ